MNCVTPCNTGLRIRVPEPRDGSGRSEGHSHTPETVDHPAPGLYQNDLTHKTLAVTFLI